MTTITINEIYIVQEYIEERIVAEKIENGDFDIYVAMLPDDDAMIPVLIDGHHSLHAALRTGNEPVIHMVECETARTVEEYVTISRERSNPETLDGATLW